MGFIQVPPDAGGKKVEANQADGTEYRQVVTPGSASSAVTQGYSNLGESYVIVNNIPPVQNVSVVSPISISGSVQVVGSTGVQAVSGSISVGNTVAVSGSISVNNFPAIQAVSGSLSINNFPASQAVTIAQPIAVSGTITSVVPNVVSVSGTLTVVQPLGSNLHVDIDNFINPIGVSGTIAISNFPTTQNVNVLNTVGVSGSVTTSLVNPIGVSGTVNIGNFPSTQNVNVLNTVAVSGNINSSLVVPNPLGVSGNISVNNFPAIQNVSVVSPVSITGNVGVSVLNTVAVSGTVTVLQGTSPWITSGSGGGTVAVQAISGSVSVLNTVSISGGISVLNNLRVSGTLVNNSPTGAYNIGVLPALVVSSSPVYTAGNQALLTVDLKGKARAKLGTLPYIIQKNGVASAGAVRSLANPFLSNVNKGTTIVVVVGLTATGSNITATDTAGNKYTLAVARTTFGGSVPGTAIFYAASNVAGALTVTVTTDNNLFAMASQIYEVDELINVANMAVDVSGGSISAVDDITNNTGQLQSTFGEEIAFVGFAINGFSGLQTLTIGADAAGNWLQEPQLNPSSPMAGGVFAFAAGSSYANNGVLISATAHWASLAGNSSAIALFRQVTQPISGTVRIVSDSTLNVTVEGDGSLYADGDSEAGNIRLIGGSVPGGLGNVVQPVSLLQLPDSNAITFALVDANGDQINSDEDGGSNALLASVVNFPSIQSTNIALLSGTVLASPTNYGTPVVGKVIPVNAFVTNVVAISGNLTVPSSLTVSGSVSVINTISGNIVAVGGVTVQAVSGAALSTAAAIVVTERGSITASLCSTLSVSGTSGSILAANSSRVEVIVTNTGTSVIYLGLGRTPSITAYHIALSACSTANDGTGGVFISDTWKGQINAIGSNNAGTICVSELT